MLPLSRAVVVEARGHAPVLSGLTELAVSHSVCLFSTALHCCGRADPKREEGGQ